MNRNNKLYQDTIRGTSNPKRYPTDFLVEEN